MKCVSTDGADHRYAALSPQARSGHRAHRRQALPLPRPGDEQRRRWPRQRVRRHVPGRGRPWRGHLVDTLDARQGVDHGRVHGRGDGAAAPSRATIDRVRQHRRRCRRCSSRPHSPDHGRRSDSGVDVPLPGPRDEPRGYGRVRRVRQRGPRPGTSTRSQRGRHDAGFQSMRVGFTPTGTGGQSDHRLRGRVPEHRRRRIQRRDRPPSPAHGRRSDSGTQDLSLPGPRDEPRGYRRVRRVRPPVLATDGSQLAGGRQDQEGRRDDAEGQGQGRGQRGRILHRLHGQLPEQRWRQGGPSHRDQASPQGHRPHSGSAPTGARCGRRTSRGPAVGARRTQPVTLPAARSAGYEIANHRSFTA